MINRRGQGYAFWLTLGILLFSGVSAEKSGTNHSQLRFIETEDAACAANGGKLVSIESGDRSQVWVVWVDRWFLGVQTADHTSHVLTAEYPAAALGCSMTNSGSQHWTIYKVQPSDSGLLQ